MKPIYISHGVRLRHSYSYFDISKDIFYNLNKRYINRYITFYFNIAI
jgi:hypothetical protein